MFSDKSLINADESALLSLDEGPTLSEPRAGDVVLNPLRFAIFRMVVERGGFTRAADAFSLTQSTVSDHIRLLETAIGSPLFDRTRRGGHLTEVGHAVYAFSVTMHRDLTTLRSHVHALRAG